MKLGLFLTPGAARTAYQVGAIQGLMDDGGLRFDVIGASSVGALNGAFAAMGRIDELARRWAGWHSRDIMGVDWWTLLRGAVLWAPNLMRYHQYRTLITEDNVNAGRLLPGTHFRFNLANLTSGDQHILEWPGAPLPLVEGVNASVAVPVLIRPYDALGQQWADGLTIDGFPLEQALLETGVERAFVVGVTPRTTGGQLYTNAVRVMLRAVEWNQQSETVVGLERAETLNQRIRSWEDDRRAAEQTVIDLVSEPDLRAALLAEVERIYAEARFPYTRGPVEIISILPEHDIPIFYADYQPERLRALLAQGRRDALRILRELDQASSVGAADGALPG